MASESGWEAPNRTLAQCAPPSADLQMLSVVALANRTVNGLPGRSARPLGACCARCRLIRRQVSPALVDAHTPPWPVPVGLSGRAKATTVFARPGLEARAMTSRSGSDVRRQVRPALALRQSPFGVPAKAWPVTSPVLQERIVRPSRTTQSGIR